MQEAFITSVLLPLTERCGEGDRMAELLSMLEHSFIDAFRIAPPASAPQDGGSGGAAAGPSPASPTALAPPSSPSLDAGEEVKLLVVRAVAAFHRRGAAGRHAAFFTAASYHPHAALFVLELLKSLGGNSQRWFRQLQLDSLDACNAIVEVIGMENVRLCLPGLVSGAVRYIHRAPSGKDASRVGLMAVQLLTSVLTTSLAAAEPAEWVDSATAHLTNALRTILDPSALRRAAPTAATAAALTALTRSVLVSPAMTGRLHTPLGALLVVAYATLANVEHLARLEATSSSSGSDASSATSQPSTSTDSVHTSQERQLSVLLRDPCAVQTVTEALQSLRGVELLHVATSAARLPALRAHFFPLRPVAAGSNAEATTLPLLLGVVRKCVRVVGAEMEAASLYTSRAPRPFPSGVVDAFLFSLAGALARLPAPDGSDDAETVGEQLTNALLGEYDAVLQDWDAYAVHPAVLYVLTRLVLWQFHPAQAAHAHPSDCRAAKALPSTAAEERCAYPAPADFIDGGALEQLWCVVAPPHLWAITEDEEACSYAQVRHRQVVAATLLRFLALSAEVLAAATHASDDHDARDRFFALTLYLVLEKAAAAGIVHEAALQCVAAYSAASGAADTRTFLLQHSSLLVDETARAVREAHLRPAAASVLRGSLALLTGYYVCGASSDEAHRDEASGVGAATCGLGLGGTGSGDAVPLPTLVRQRLSVSAVAAFFARHTARLATLVEAEQIADFVASTMHVACDALQLCSRYDSAAPEEDVAGRRAALWLLRDALDLAAYANLCTPQEPLDETQERRTTSAHTRVRALQATALEAVYAVLQHCTVHDVVAATAVQTVVRGLTCFLTTTAALTSAETARQRCFDDVAARRRAKREAARQRGRSGDEQEGSGEEGDEEDPSSAPLPTPPVMDWPWTHYATPSAAASADLGIALPRSHLHTVYRVYLSLFALLREPLAAFARAKADARGRTGAERRRLGDVAVSPAVFATLHGLEAIRALAYDFLVHRMVEEVLPVVLLWHERSRLPRIPTHTEERLRQAAEQFAVHLHDDCASTPEIRASMRVMCQGFHVLPD